MKKLSLLSLLIMLFALTASAIGVDEYVSTTSSRYKITGENICVNGQFDGYTGWSPVVDSDTTDLATCFSLVTDAELQGYAMKSVAGGDTLKGFYQMIQTDESSSYVVSFKIRNQTGKVSTLTSKSYVNYINLFANTSGNVEDQATSEDTGVTYTSCGYTFVIGTEWTTVYFAFDNTLGQSQYLFLEFSGIATDTEIGDVEIHQATKVCDPRKAQKLVDYAEMLVAQEFFLEMREDLQEEIDNTKLMMETEDYDTAGDDQVDALQNMIDAFIEENTEDYYYVYYGDATEKNNDSPNWNQWTASYNRASLTSYAGWAFSGGNWGNRADADGDGTPDTTTGRPVWFGSLGYGQEYPGPASAGVAKRTFSLPAGKYMTEIQLTGGHMSGWGSQGLNYVINTQDTCMHVKIFIGNDTINHVMVSPVEYNKVTNFFDAKDNQKFVFGYSVYIDESYAGLTYGGNVDFYYPVLRRIKDTNPKTLNAIKMLEDVTTQMTSTKTSLETANSYYNDTQYPWGKETLKSNIDKVQAHYDYWAAMSEDEIIAYWDEGNQSPADTIRIGGSKAMGIYNSNFLDDNNPVVTLKTYLDEAYTTYDDPANAKADKPTYKAVIDAAQAVYDKCFTITEKTYEDSLACREQVVLLDEAKMDFKNSIANKDNPSKISIVNGDFAEYSGSKGTFAATGWDIITEDSNGGWQHSTWWDTGTCNIAFNRGYTAAPINKATQIITLKSPGYYTFTFRGYAYNCVESYDKQAAVYAQVWDEDWEEWVTTDSIDHYVGCEAFFGINGAPDSIHVHKDLNAANLEGASLYCDGKSGTYMYSCPPDYYQITVKKETTEPEEYEFGVSFLNNTYYCDGGFGDCFIYYTGQDYPYNPVVSAGSDVLAGDANGDSVIDVADITAIAAYILGSTPEAFNEENADANGDSVIDVADITATAAIILGN